MRAEVPSGFLSAWIAMKHTKYVVIILATPAHQLTSQGLRFVQVVRIVAKVRHAVENQQIGFIPAKDFACGLPALIWRQLRKAATTS